MNGIQEVSRMKQRLDATFECIETIDSSALELKSDFAKYLCVLVSGYIERAIAEIVQEHARRNGSSTLQKFVEARTSKTQSAHPQRIIELLGSFRKEWGHEIKQSLSEDQWAAIHSMVRNRHQIVHGRDYYEKSHNLIIRVQELCLGESLA